MSNIRDDPKNHIIGLYLLLVIMLWSHWSGRPRPNRAARGPRTKMSLTPLFKTITIPKTVLHLYFLLVTSNSFLLTFCHFSFFSSYSHPFLSLSPISFIYLSMYMYLSLNLTKHYHVGNYFRNWSEFANYIMANCSIVGVLFTIYNSGCCSVMYFCWK